MRALRSSSSILCTKRSNPLRTADGMFNRGAACIGRKAPVFLTSIRLSSFFQAGFNVFCSSFSLYVDDVCPQSESEYRAPSRFLFVDKPEPVTKCARFFDSVCAFLLANSRPSIESIAPQSPLLTSTICGVFRRVELSSVTSLTSTIC